jgi:hypothetical protein
MVKGTRSWSICIPYVTLVTLEERLLSPTKVTNPRFKSRISALLADEECVKMIATIKDRPKSPQAMVSETLIPMSTFYRKVSELKAVGLVIVEGFEIRSGKKVEYLRTAFSEVKVVATGNGVAVELIPVSEHVRLKWLALFGPDGL